MYTRLAITLALALFFGAAAYGQGAMSLGGVAPADRLGTVLDKMHTPDAVKARRMENPGDDHAAFLYNRQGAVVVSLTPRGDQVQGVITESPTMVMEDGTKVGSPRSRIVSKYGEPADTDSNEPGVTEYWYWAQGVNFDINDASGSVVRIYVFPPVQQPVGNMQRASLPGRYVNIGHRYVTSGRRTQVTGTIKSRVSSPRYGVRVGITLLDKKSKPVTVRYCDVGSLLPGGSRSFAINVPPKGKWSAYRVTVESLSPLNVKGFMATTLRQQDQNRSMRQWMLSSFLWR